MPRHFDNTWLERISGYLKAITGVKSGSADNNGDVVKVGGEYNATPYTYVDGSRVALQLDANGNLKITSSSSIGTTGSFDHGSNRDVDTAAEALTSTSFSAVRGVTVVADRDNTGIVYVGNSDVTAGTTAGTDGFPLGAGESVTLEVNNPNLIYVIGSANNQIVYWTAV